MLKNILRNSLIALYVDDLLIACSNKKMCRDLEKEFSAEFSMKIMGSVNHILGMDVRNSVDNHTVHLSQTQHIINVKNKLQQHGLYCYGTPIDSKASYGRLYTG